MSRYLVLNLNKVIGKIYGPNPETAWDRALLKYPKATHIEEA